MDSKRIYCLQFVVQDIRKNPDADIEEIQRVGIKFGEQVIYIQNKKLSFKNNVIELRKGKICFFEEENLGFEFFIEVKKNSKVSTNVSFISFQDKKNKSILNTELELKNSSRKTIFTVTVIGSRHLVENLGKVKESFSIGTQTPVVLKKSDSCQTEPIEFENTDPQMAVKIGNNVLDSTLQIDPKIRENFLRELTKYQTSNFQVDLNTKEILPIQKEYQHSNLDPKPETKTISTQTIFNQDEGKKQLFKLVLFLVYKISLKLASTRNQEDAVPEEPKVSLKDARQFSELRKRQIEEMRERLRVMAEARKEILEQTEKKLNLKPENKSPLIERKVDKPVDKFMDEPQPSNLTFSVEDPKPIPVFANVPEVLPEPIHIPEALSPSKASSRSRGSTVPSPMGSDVFDDFEELQEVDTTVKERRKSYTLNQDRERNIGPVFGSSLGPSSAFLSPNAPYSNKNKSVEKVEESTAESVSTELNSTESDTSATSEASSSTSSSRTNSDSSSAESSSSSSVVSESSKENKNTKKGKTKKEVSPPSPSSSTFGEGSVDTVESIQEELPSAKSSSSLGISSNSDTPRQKAPPQKTPNPRRVIPDIRRKSVHTDSVSSYAPSD